jgi:hypothetical protein
MASALSLYLSTYMAAARGHLFAFLPLQLWQIGLRFAKTCGPPLDNGLT